MSSSSWKSRRSRCRRGGSRRRGLHLGRNRERTRVRVQGGGRLRRDRGRRAAFGEHRVVRIELASERDGLLPRLALALAHRVELGGDGLERRRLVVLRVDLEQLEVDLLALRILLERVLEDFLGLGVAPVGKVDLGFGDRVDFVGVDVAEALAAEVALQRVLAGVDDAAAGRAEHRVGLDVGARDDAVLELRRLATPGGHQCGNAAQYRERAGADRPRGRVRHQFLEERRLRRRRRRGLGDRLGRRGRGRGGYRRGLRSLRRLLRLRGFGRLHRLGDLRRFDLRCLGDLRGLDGLRRLGLRRNRRRSRRLRLGRLRRLGGLHSLRRLGLHWHGHRRCRGLRLGGLGLRLRRRKRRALQFDGALHVAHGLLEFGDARLRFGELLRARHRVLGSRAALGDTRFARDADLVAARRHRPALSSRRRRSVRRFAPAPRRRGADAAT